jgi:hypothetical protein
MKTANRAMRSSLDDDQRMAGPEARQWTVSGQI